MDELIAYRVARLTDRRQRLLRLAASGAPAAELALRLGLSRRQVGREVAAVLLALGVQTLDEAALLWWGSRAGARTELRAAAQALAARPAAPTPRAA
jgi:DNA-binding CsgD family transcriptional regulator